MIGTTSTSRRTRGLWTLIGVIGLMGGLAACDDDDDDITGPTGVVTVVRDQNFAFATLHTFAMPDTVIHFAPLTGAALDVSREFDRAALDEVRQNLLLRGYTQVTNPQTTQPDFVVLVGSTATTNYNAYVSYPWFDVWGFYPGWGWYTPGFSSAWGIAYPWSGEVGVTAYDRGTMVVTIIPTVSVNATNEMVNASWAGVASALLDGTVTSTSVANAVDLMFQKSPYLTATTTTASRTGQ
jgi:hypothetical protein